MIERDLMNQLAQLGNLMGLANGATASESNEGAAMHGNASRCTVVNIVQPTQKGLSPRQVKALTLLLAGVGSDEVAREVGVNPSTVWRWRHRDPRFMAEFNRCFDAVAHAAAARMNRLVSRSLDVVESQLDSKMAITCFRAASLMVRLGARRIPAMPTAAQLDPEQIAATLVKAGVDVRELEQPDEEQKEVATDGARLD